MTTMSFYGAMYNCPGQSSDASHGYWEGKVSIFFSIAAPILLSATKGDSFSPSLPECMPRPRYHTYGTSKSLAALLTHHGTLRYSGNRIGNSFEICEAAG